MRQYDLLGAPMPYDQHGLGQDFSAVTFTLDASFSNVSTTGSGVYSVSVQHGPTWWTGLTADPAGPRYYLASAYDAAANVAYAIAGYNLSSALSNVTAFRRDTNSWTALAALPKALYDLAAAYDMWSGLTYTVNGNDPSTGSAVRANYAFNYKTNTWTAMSAPTTATRGHGLAYSLNRNVTYRIDGSLTSACEAYSYTSNTWSSIASDVIARVWLSAVYAVPEDLVYAVDGSTNYTNGATKSLSSYNGQTNAWTSLASDTFARYSLSAAYDLKTDLVYAIGGRDPSGYSTGFPGTSMSTWAVYAYLPSTNGWTWLPNYPTYIEGHGAVYDLSTSQTYVFDGITYLGGGSTTWPARAAFQY